MSILQRAATFAAISLGIFAFAGANTPGQALENDSPRNALALLPVPTLVEEPSPAESVDAPGVVRSTSSPQADAPETGVIAAPEPQTSDFVFESLADAVAAQDMPVEMDSDLRCLAGATYFEAKGEPLVGQLAVAEVIINRARSGRFASSICDVVTQPGQFSFVRGGRIPAIPNNDAWRTAVAVAQVAMADHWDSPARTALYFHARHVSPGWRMARVARIGNHVFYR